MIKDYGKVSIIVPIFNVEKWIRECVISILNQTYKNIEILLIDDGSPDSSGEICDELSISDERIHVFHLQNGGVSRARNYGLDNANGEFVMFIDGDDYLNNECVEYFVSLINEFDCDAAYSENCFISNKDPQVEDKRWVISGEEAAIAQLCYRTNIGVWNKLFRKKLLEDVRFITTQYIGEGFNFNVTAFQIAAKVAVGTRKIYFYRQDNTTSATKKFSEEKWINGLQSIEEINSNMIISSKGLTNAWEFAKWRTYTDIYVIMKQSVDSPEKSDLFLEARNYTKKNAKYAFKCNTSWKERISAVLFGISPNLICLKIYARKLIYRVLGR
jgi:glycosyltransferase involved in cell wall biosynthesis